MLFRLGIAAAIAAIAAAAQDAALDRFEKEIRPVLAERCYTCHSASPRRYKADCCSIPQMASGAAEIRVS